MVNRSRTSSIAGSQEAWDSALLGLGGHFLQSWRWGEFKSNYGWEVERLASNEGGAMGQVLFRRKGPLSVGYVPRGPAWEPDGETLATLVDQIDHASRSHRALFSIVELDRYPDESGNALADWDAGPPHIQPSRTVKVELGTDDEILKRMHQKTRYSVRLAIRKGVEVERYSGMHEAALSIFYGLLSETSDRNEFGIHSRLYYTDFLKIFGDQSLLLIARVEGRPAAGLIAVSFGDEAIYMYGGSSAQHRAHGAAFLLQFEAMRWARDMGCKRYDLWGIPRLDPDAPEDHSDAVPSTKGDDWRGLHRFKIGFGGQITDYPETLEHRYHPLAARLAKRLSGGLGRG